MHLEACPSSSFCSTKRFRFPSRPVKNRILLHHLAYNTPCTSTRRIATHPRQRRLQWGLEEATPQHFATGLNSGQREALPNTQGHA